MINLMNNFPVIFTFKKKLLGLCSKDCQCINCVNQTHLTLGLFWAPLSQQVHTEHASWLKHLGTGRGTTLLHSWVAQP